jgi:endo-1,4-beta-D-glucanase Y
MSHNIKPSSGTNESQSVQFTATEMEVGLADVEYTLARQKAEQHMLRSGATTTAMTTAFTADKTRHTSRSKRQVNEVIMVSFHANQNPTDITVKLRALTCTIQRL